MGAGAGYTTQFDITLGKYEFLDVRVQEPYYELEDENIKNYFPIYRVFLDTQDTEWSTHSEYEGITSDCFDTVRIDGYIDIEVDGYYCSSLEEAKEKAEESLYYYLQSEDTVSIFYSRGWIHKNLPNCIFSHKNHVKDSNIDLYDVDISCIDNNFNVVGFRFELPELAEYVNNFYACPEAWYELEEAV